MRRRSYKWWVEADFWWVAPTLLGSATVAFTIMDSIDPYTSDYRVWAAGCAVAMLLHAVRLGPK